MKLYYFRIENARLNACSIFHLEQPGDEWARIKGREIAAALAPGTVMKITTEDAPGVIGTVAIYQR